MGLRIEDKHPNTHIRNSRNIPSWTSGVCRALKSLSVVLCHSSSYEFYHMSFVFPSPTSSLLPKLLPPNGITQFNTSVQLMLLGGCRWKYFVTGKGFLHFFCLFRASPMAYGGSQARGQIGAVAAGQNHSHSNVGSKPPLWPTPQLMTTSGP